MKTSILPDYWKTFVEKHSLVGTEIDFPWPGDGDSMATVEILGDEYVEEEAKEHWPGIGVFQDGFVPVGACSVGTGDPYFINTNDGPNGPLYKIDHERVSPDGYNRDEAVETMLEHYEDLLKYIIK
ncbi:MAG: hypothetical protein OET90_02340 [Desulfuromonadales bacterium]|nr:hypothetical protein [Desulfuromonadales bacterium]